ncbi:chaperone modulator CbpM [Silvimonas soli]|uniref:chaperone modulator CbpM n=1 Tax=Silvimonas soli TaxID=2980100 RepID=UPI0024B34C35|nr:chaperone modulator CbpM [Silvimonas soli]
MSETNPTVIYGVLVEENVLFTLAELSQACQADVSQLVALVDEGVLIPQGDAPTAWRFGGTTLKRARIALRLINDLELRVVDTALILDLLDQIDVLTLQLRRFDVH